MGIHTLMEKDMWKGVLFAEIYSLLGFKSATASLEKLQETSANRPWESAQQAHCVGARFDMVGNIIRRNCTDAAEPQF
jgi:hypothetical protein